MLHSDDGGLTWSKPENISAQAKRADWTWYATGPGNGIQLRNGRLLIPCNHRMTKVRNDKSSFSHVLYSDDHGKTWQIGGVAEKNTNECQVAELDNDDVLLSIRSHENPGKKHAFATSVDKGLTWSPVWFDQSLPDPTSQASLIGLKSGADGKTSLLFSNPASTKRERMTVRLSNDRGKTWPLGKVLHEGPAGYSSLVELPAGQAGCFYEQGGKGAKEGISLVFARFGLNSLSLSPAVVP